MSPPESAATAAIAPLPGITTTPARAPAYRRVLLKLSGEALMRTPIAQALAAPERIASGTASLDLTRLGELTFEAPDRARFPCIGLAYDALAADASASIALNAANEVAVDAFLAGRARFSDIPRTCADALARHEGGAVASLDDALAIDARAREIARAALRVHH